MSETNTNTQAFEATTKRTKKQLAEDAIKRFLTEAGGTILGATVAIGGIRKLNDDPRDYKHTLTVEFDGTFDS